MLNNKKEEALKLLSEGMNRHSSIAASFRKELLKILVKYDVDLPIVKKKFKLNVEFFKFFDSNISKSDNLDSNIEQKYYKNFNRLKKFNLIHKQSSTFAKSLSLISINPNQISLLSSKFSNTFKFIKNYEEIKNKILLNNDLSIYYVYIYLRLFSYSTLSKFELSKIIINNILLLEKDFCVQYFDKDIYFSIYNNKAYKLHVYDRFISSFFYMQHEKLSENEYLFSDIIKFEKFFLQYKKEKFGKIGINQIKYMNRNYYIFTNSSIKTTVYSKILATKELSISELNVLYPNKISKKFIELEKQIIEKLFKVSKVDRDEIDTIVIGANNESDISSFTIHDIDTLMIFLREKGNQVKKSSINNIIKELQLYYAIDQNLHTQMICDYITYLLLLTKEGKLRPSSVRGYLYILNKYLFKQIENLNNIEESEVQNIEKILSSDNYKLSYLKKIRRLINSFFKYNEKNGIEINISGTHYDKSMIFNLELNFILDEIEKSYRDRMRYKMDNKVKKFVVGKNDKYRILQEKILVLFGYYFGMRKNEARSRLICDMYFNNNYIYIDVNNEGLKKIKLKLKTSSSTRRIGVKIENKKHLELIKKWYNDREEILKKISFKKNKYNQYLLLDSNEKGSFLQTIIKEDTFNHINEIIKKVTERYCTYHSLRHSFATNQMAEIFSKIDENPYDALEFSVSMGHETPEITLSSYTHAQIIYILLHLNLEKGIQ